MIGIIRALNESLGSYFRPPHSTDKTTLIDKERKKAKKELIQSSTTPGPGHHMGKCLQDIQGKE